LCGTAATNCWYSCSDRILDFPCLADFTGSYIASVGTMIPLEWIHCKYQWNIIAHADTTSYQKSVGLMGLHRRHSEVHGLFNQSIANRLGLNGYTYKRFAGIFKKWCF
jgi:hypothetical protein